MKDDQGLPDGEQAPNESSDTAGAGKSLPPSFLFRAARPRTARFQNL